MENVRRPPKREERNNAGISDSDDSNYEGEEMPTPQGRVRGGRASRARQARTMPTTSRTTSSRARGRARGSQSTSRPSSVSGISVHCDHKCFDLKTVA